MRLCYLLLSPTFGMHQYTADLANRMVRQGHAVHLVTTMGYPADRYAPEVTCHPMVHTSGTGASAEALRMWQLPRIVKQVRQMGPDLVHITGPHAWNPLLLRALRRAGTPTVHTIHDVEPHADGLYGALVRAWNRVVTRQADHVLVHGEQYRELLLASGLSPNRVTAVPLTHLFVGAPWEARLVEATSDVAYEPLILFFGRLEPYKGVEVLLDAWRKLPRDLRREATLVLAGSGDLAALWADDLPEGVELRNHRIGDDEAVELFRRCAALVLPYTRATQSALVAATYCFRKPVIATRSGALAEYVRDRETGWLVEPGDADGLAAALQQALAGRARGAEVGARAREWYDEAREREERTLLHVYGGLGGQRRQSVRRVRRTMEGS